MEFGVDEFWSYNLYLNLKVRWLNERAYKSGGLIVNDTMQFLVQHGYIMLFLFVFAEQIGLPVPALPVLLAAGALAGSKSLNFGFIIILALLASLLSDFIWYQIGRYRGSKVLNFLCRISL